MSGYSLLVFKSIYPCYLTCLESQPCNNESIAQSLLINWVQSKPTGKLALVNWQSKCRDPHLQWPHWRTNFYTYLLKLGVVLWGLLLINYFVNWKVCSNFECRFLTLVEMKTYATTTSFVLIPWGCWGMSMSNSFCDEQPFHSMLQQYEKDF